jgi:hypothetical protein
MNKYLEKVAEKKNPYEDHSSRMGPGAKAFGRGILEGTGGSLVGGALGAGVGHALGGARGALLGGAAAGLVGSVAGSIHGHGKSVHNTLKEHLGSRWEDKTSVWERGARAVGRGVLHGVPASIIPFGGIPGSMHGSGTSIKNQLHEEMHKKAQLDSLMASGLDFSSALKLIK